MHYHFLPLILLNCSAVSQITPNEIEMQIRSHTYPQPPIITFTEFHSCQVLSILLSPDAKRPPSRLLAHSGARYEISNVRYINGAGTRNSTCSSGGVLLGQGAAFHSLLATCAPSPCASKLFRKPEAFPLWGLGPPKMERVQGWHR